MNFPFEIKYGIFYINLIYFQVKKANDISYYSSSSIVQATYYIMTRSYNVQLSVD